jgi:hypothetical protein
VKERGGGKEAECEAREVERKQLGCRRLWISLGMQHEMVVSAKCRS